MQTQQERMQKEEDKKYAKIINRRLLETRVKLSDYISDEQFESLKIHLRIVFKERTGIEYQVSNADYAELFSILYLNIGQSPDGYYFQELEINIYQLSTICKMLSTGVNRQLMDDESIYDMLLFKVEMNTLDILFESEIAKIEDATMNELKSDLELARKNGKA
jgi:hypothetical protein